ncbi:phage tail domain-containing protein [Listeria kieliensis]
MKPQLELIINNNQRIPFTEIYAKDVIDLGREAPILKNNDLQFDYMDGSTEVDSNFQPFPFVLEFVLEVGGWVFLQTKLQEMYEVLYQRSAYYLHTNLMPGIFYKARVSDLQLTKWNGSIAQIKIEWSVIKGYGESIGTTLSDFSFHEDLWQIGQGLRYDDFKYRFNTNKFKVLNVGSLDIDPREHELNIRIKSKSLKEFTLINHTTRDKYVYYPQLRSVDELVISNATTLLNGVSCTRDTNKQLVSLKSGWNAFEIKNASDVNISFDFRFLYK